MFSKLMLIILYNKINVIQLNERLYQSQLLKNKLIIIIS